MCKSNNNRKHFRESNVAYVKRTVRDTDDPPLLDDALDHFQQRAFPRDFGIAKLGDRDGDRALLRSSLPSSEHWRLSSNAAPAVGDKRVRSIRSSDIPRVTLVCVHDGGRPARPRGLLSRPKRALCRVECSRRKMHGRSRRARIHPGCSDPARGVMPTGSATLVRSVQDISSGSIVTFRGQRS